MNLTDSPPSSIPLTKQILWGLPLPSQSLFNIKPWLLVEHIGQRPHEMEHLRV